MSRPTFLNIDLSALRHNLSKIRHFAPGKQIIAMVKANAYGHGLIRIAQALRDADALGVASLEEGIKLREAGIQQKIILMEGLFYPDEIAEAARHQFTLVIHHEPHLKMLEETQHPFVFSVWLKINTGMNRLGILPEQASDFYKRLSALPNITQPIGLMTHFSSADEIDKDITMRQMDCFYQTVRAFSGPLSLANSAAIIAWPQSHGHWVRPGLMLYGASPLIGCVGRDHGLRPVMSLRSRLIAISQVRKDDCVGYGGTWQAPADMRIGVVGVGYGDGYPQFAKNGTPIIVNGKQASLIGRVSMDMLTVDLRGLEQVQIGDEVILWGDELPVEEVARYSHTSAYEILTRMTPRPKIEVHD